MKVRNDEEKWNPVCMNLLEDIWTLRERKRK
jgi:hypothetical protein